MDDEKPYSGGNYRGAEHASPYPVSRLGAPVSPVDTGRAIETAAATVAMRTNAQLEVGARAQSWTRIDEIEARDRRKAEIQAFASGRLLRDAS